MPRIKQVSCRHYSLYAIEQSFICTAHARDSPERMLIVAKGRTRLISRSRGTPSKSDGLVRSRLAPEGRKSEFL